MGLGVSPFVETPFILRLTFSSVSSLSHRVSVQDCQSAVARRMSQKQTTMKKKNDVSPNYSCMSELNGVDGCSSSVSPSSTKGKPTECVCCPLVCRECGMRYNAIHYYNDYLSPSCPGRRWSRIEIPTCPVCKSKHPFHCPFCLSKQARASMTSTFVAASSIATSPKDSNGSSPLSLSLSLVSRMICTAPHLRIR